MTTFFRSTRFLILALVGASILALLSVAGAAGLGVRHVSHLEDTEVVEGIRLIEAAYQLKTAAIQEVLAVRDYALTGNPVFLNNARNQIRLYDATFAAVVSLDQHPEDAQLLRELQALDATFDTFTGQLRALKEQGLESAAVTLLVTEGRPLIDRWVSRLDDLIARQEHHVDDAHRNVVKTERQIFLVLSGISITAIPLAIALGGLVLWRFLRPLAQLEAASRAIAAHQLNVRVEVTRDDEFGAVGQAFNTMASEVQATMTELKEANERLVQADRYKDEFLSIVSHELRTPLSFIKGFAGVLATGMAGPVTAEQRDYLKNIVTGADRMSFLVNDLLDLATIQAGKLRLNVELQPIAPVIAEAIDSLKPLAQEKGIEMTGDGPLTPPVEMDRQRILQVLTNLVANAIKFTPSGGRVTVAGRWSDDKLRVEVTDTGIGIKPEDHSKLFQRFNQLDMSDTRKVGGTGLGLSICKALIEAHGGKIGVHSALECGSTFWFELCQQVGERSD